MQAYLPNVVSLIVFRILQSNNVALYTNYIFHDLTGSVSLNPKRSDVNFESICQISINKYLATVANTNIRMIMMMMMKIKCIDYPLIKLYNKRLLTLFTYLSNRFNVGEDSVQHLTPRWRALAKHLSCRTFYWNKFCLLKKKIFFSLLSRMGRHCSVCMHKKQPVTDIGVAND